MRDILKKGADVACKDIKGCNAVHFAAKSGSAEALEALSAFKANFDQINSDGQNPFHFACQERYQFISEMILTRILGIIVFSIFNSQILAQSFSPEIV